MEKKMNGENNLVEHTVKISDYVQLSIKIPKVLDAIEFNSVLSMARRAMNISEVNIQASRKKAKKNGRVHIEDVKAFLKEYKKSDAHGKREMVKKYGFRNYEALQSKVYNIRKAR
jgi:hypothetical protein